MGWLFPLFSFFAFASTPQGAEEPGARARNSHRLSNGCLNAQEQEKIKTRHRCLRESNGERFAVSHLSMEEARRAFETLKNNREFNWLHVEDGCQQRAHRAGQVLEAMGIIAGKFFTVGQLVARHPTIPSQYVRWTGVSSGVYGYHVAVFVLVTQGNEDTPMILDPALGREPLTYDRWILAQLVTGDAELRGLQMTDRHAYQYSGSLDHAPGQTPLDPQLRRIRMMMHERDGYSTAESPRSTRGRPLEQRDMESGMYHQRGERIPKR